MQSTDSAKNIRLAAEQFARDVQAATQTVCDAFYAALHPFLYQPITQEMIDKALEQLEEEYVHVPPTLTPTQSRANYSFRSFQQPKGRYRKQRTWRHQG